MLRSCSFKQYLPFDILCNSPFLVIFESNIIVRPVDIFSSLKWFSICFAVIARHTNLVSVF